MTTSKVKESPVARTVEFSSFSTSDVNIVTNAEVNFIPGFALGLLGRVSNYDDNYLRALNFEVGSRLEIFFKILIISWSRFV